MIENKLGFLREKLENQYGKELTEKIFEGYSVNRKTTFRVNTLKSNIEEIEKVLLEEKINFRKVNFIKGAYVLENNTEKDLQRLKIYENGKIYLQSLSSMIPAMILKPRENADILDMAAAPRWKNNANSCIS